MTPRARAEVAATWSSSDTAPWLAPLAAVGLAGAALLGLFGLPPLDLHGPLHDLGVMDPLCGATRASRFLVTARWRLAWAYNPGVFVLAAVLGLGLVRWMVGAATGRWLRIRASRRLVLLIALVGLVALELNQQAHAALLSRP